MLAQRYAYDFVVTDDKGATHNGDGSGPEDYYCYGDPVVSPADGVVVAASDGHRDYHRAGGWLDPRQRDMRGNYLTIKHADGEYSLFAHLKEDSIRVLEGERVERGERIGRCGHSGNSTEPHLHFQLQDRPSFFRSMGLPIQFENALVRDPDGETEKFESAYIREGQRVTALE
ncbi:M23 family metallopeptidase [Haloferax profundi]|nr:M23 family metallopeptidase [Haloferax profundi]